MRASPSAASISGSTPCSAEGVPGSAPRWSMPPSARGAPKIEAMMPRASMLPRLFLAPPRVHPRRLEARLSPHNGGFRAGSSPALAERDEVHAGGKEIRPREADVVGARAHGPDLAPHDGPAGEVPQFEHRLARPRKRELDPQL